ncbi:MAG: DsbA family protein [Gammaproteobacteria bacterium]|nr:DsbA family protein [Gammaproteobacteria bacterium]
MKLYYVHDPMCSWCWAFRPVLLALKDKLPKDIEFIRLLGGLAPDRDIPMSEETKRYVIDNWRRIQQQLPETQFNYDFWEKCKPRRSTYPACRAVLAARKQGAQHDEAMTYAIQQAYYLQAKNPSDNETLIALAKQLGLNVSEFSQDLNSININELLLHEIHTARELKLNSFPSFLLMGETQAMHIKPDYSHAEMILDKIQHANL